jgi:hypothetical protein
MRGVLCVSLVAFLAFLAPPPSAAMEQTVSGAQEWSGAFAFSYSGYSTESSSASMTMVAIGPGYGFFVADNVELKLDLAVALLSYGNGSSESQTTLGVDAQALVHFPSEGNVVPFVGGGLGFGTASDSSSRQYDPTLTIPVLTGGVKIFLTDSGCLTVAASYSHQINALYSEDVSGNIFAVSASYSIFRF